MNPRYVSSWMWSEAVRMLDEADRISQQFFRVQAVEHAAGVWEPPVDIYETESAWTVLAALPGVPPERIGYRLEGDMLEIAAERSVPEECGQGLVRRKEVPHGRFVRRLRFQVPPVEITRAKLKDGCLILILGKPNS